LDTAADGETATLRKPNPQPAGVTKADQPKKTNCMFKLIDTFNNCTISNHRTLDAAVRAKSKHSRAICKANGSSSYIPKKIVEVIDGEESPVDYYELMAAEQHADQS